MKKLLVIAIALATANAFASRARINSLGNSPQIIDTQRIYTNPSDAMGFGDFTNLESGTTTQGAENGNAEGLVIRSYGDSKAGLSLGHRSANGASFGLRSSLLLAGVASAGLNQQNPVELTWATKSGDAVYGVTLVYSNYNDKQADLKESSGGFRIGMRQGAFDGSLGIGLLNTVKGAGVDYKGTIGLIGLFGYTVDDLYYYGKFNLAGAKNDSSPAAQKLNTQDISVGVVSTTKKDGNEFFYGASLRSVNTKIESSNAALDGKVTSLALPVIVGLEAEATSWLTLRGSLTQNVLINNSKNEVAGLPGGTSEFSPGANNTVASVGAGLKFNKITLDGSLQGLTGGTAGQNIDGNSLLTTVGLTYVF